MFYLGVFQPEKLTNINPHSSNYNKYLQVLSLYSKSTGQFSDYSDLNDIILSRWLYNANLAISKITGDEIDIDSHLRKLPFTNIIVGKMEPLGEFLALFEENSFSLNAIQNFNDAIFSQTGQYLKENNYTNTRAYEAGFAFRMMLLEMDLKGTTFLFARMNSYMTPLFEALFNTPLLFVFNQNALKASHFISMGYQNQSTPSV